MSSERRSPRNATGRFWRHRRRVLGVFIAVAACVGGCSAPEPIFTPLAEPLVWPGPPDPPRIEYVGQILTSADLKPGKSFLQGFGDAVFGGESARSMLTPYAVTTDGADRLFVTDTNGQVVHVFDLQTRRYEQWKPPADTDPFAQPVGLAYDRVAGRLLVSDSVAAAITVFDGKGDHMGRIGADLLTRPAGLAVDPVRDRIIVADTGAHQIVVFRSDGQLIRRIGRRGVALSEFNYPTNVAVDGQGRVYVADSLNFRVQVFDAELRPLRQIGSQGDLPGYFSQPKGLAVDSEDHLYVVDAHFEAVQVFDTEGQLLLSFGREGHGPGEFWLPAGLHIGVDDRIWVADAYNRRVQVFQYLKHTESEP